MQILASLGLAAMVMVSAASSPIDVNTTSSVALEKRRDGRLCNPNGVEYSNKQVQDTYDEAIQFWRDGHAEFSGLSDKPYPASFGNGEGLDWEHSTCQQDFNLLFEFPILEKNGPFRTGKDPGPDRVLFGIDGGGTVYHCFLMTHTGAERRNGFITCNGMKVGKR